MPIIRSSVTPVVASGLPLERDGSSTVGRGRAGRPDHDQQHCYHHVPTVKPEAVTAVIELLMMGMRMPKTCGTLFKRPVINLRNCCIWLVDSFEINYIVITKHASFQSWIMATNKKKENSYMFIGHQILIETIRNL
jgi:hypothetical protein